MNRNTELGLWTVAFAFNAGFFVGGLFNPEYSALIACINAVAAIGCLYRIYSIIQNQ